MSDELILREPFYERAMRGVSYQSADPDHDTRTLRVDFDRKVTQSQIDQIKSELAKLSPAWTLADPPVTLARAKQGYAALQAIIDSQANAATKTIARIVQEILKIQFDEADR